MEVGFDCGVKLTGWLEASVQGVDASAIGVDNLQQAIAAWAGFHMVIADLCAGLPPIVEGFVRGGGLACNGVEAVNQGFRLIVVLFMV